MRKSSLRLTFDDFDGKLLFYADFVNRIVYAQRVIRFKYEKVELLEAFVLRLVTSWDVFVRDLFVDCLNKDAAKYADYMGLRLKKHLSIDECQAMLTGLGYFEFRGVTEARNAAGHVLVVNPFPAIPNPSIKKIDELVAIRNYLAHYSGRAQRALQRVYTGRYRMSTFRRPGEFLYADTKPGQIRFVTYVKALADASVAMRDKLGIAS